MPDVLTDKEVQDKKGANKRETTLQNDVAERGKPLKSMGCKKHALMLDWHKRLHTQAYLSAFWDTVCRRQTCNVTGKDMLITDRTDHLTDGICVCVCVFAQTEQMKNEECT